MNRASHRKNNYALTVLAVLFVAIIFGFLFDIICTQIEYKVYPKPEEYKEYVEKYSKEYGLSEELVYSVIKTESGFDSSAVSSKGAVGLMQIMPETFEWLTNDILHEYLDVGMLYDPETNIKYGTYYLSRLYGRFGDLNTAIAAYNGGEGNVSEWLSDPRYSNDGEKLIVDNIPKSFSETENYVKKVNKYLGRYRDIYNKK